jgi:hypothetical protein
MTTSMARPVRWAEQMVRIRPWQLLSRAQRWASASGARKPEKIVNAPGGAHAAGLRLGDHPAIGVQAPGRSWMTLPP